MSLGKDEVVKLIKGRIEDEYRKHPALDWAQISASKIYSQWFEYLNNENKALKEQLLDKEEQIKLKDCAYSDIGSKYSKMFDELNDLKSQIVLIKQNVILNYNTAIDLSKQLSVEQQQNEMLISELNNLKNK